MQNQILTTEQQADIDARVAEFKEKYTALAKESQIDLVSFPQYIPLPDGTFVTRIAMTPVDTKYLPVMTGQVPPDPETK